MARGEPGHGTPRNPARLRPVRQGIGIEWEAYGLTARNGMRLQAAFDGFASLIDASDLVSRQRLVKSPAEIAYVRKAAELGALALDEAHRLAGPGVSEQVLAHHETPHVAVRQALLAASQLWKVREQLSSVAHPRDECRRGSEVAISQIPGFFQKVVPGPD